MALFRKKGSKKEKLNKTEKKGYSFGPIDAMNLYTRLFADWVTKGRNDSPEDTLEGDEVLGDKSFFYSVNRVFTNKGIKKPYFLELPQNIERGFISDLREEVDRAVVGYNQANQLDENVSVTCIADGENFKVDLSQGRMQGMFRIWARDYERLSRKAQNKSLEDELQSDKHTKDTRHKVGSYLYMKEAVEKEKASFFKTNIIIELVATSDDVLDEADRAIKAFFYTKEIKSKGVFIQTNEYMRTFTPMVTGRESLIKQMNPKSVFADETISSLTVPTHGVIGDEHGIYHGVDIMSRRVVTFDMLHGSRANNVLLTAQTEQGKSTFAKMLYTFYPLHPQFSTVVYDYEGTEYTPLARVIGANIISLTSASGRFVNTMVIGRLTGKESIDEELKTTAVTSTMRIFDILVDVDEGMSGEKRAIVSSAIKSVYLDFGVTNEKESWINSEGITFFHIYQRIVDFLNHEKYQDERRTHGEDELKNLINILMVYFEEGQVYKHWFKESISVQEIIDKKHVVFSFGMGSSAEATEDERSLALRQLFASHITTLMSHYNVQHNRKTVVFLEELQRYLKLRYSGDIIAKFVSGGRKQGMITYLITNSPSELISLTESMDDHVQENASIIMSGVTMFLIGALMKRDMENLIQEFDLSNARGVLNQLSSVAEGQGTNDGLKYCFYVRYKGQSALLRMLSHPALEELPLYKTIDLKDEHGESTGLRTVEKHEDYEVEEGLLDAEKRDNEMKKKGADFGDYRDEYQNTKGLWKKTDNIKID